MNTLTASTYSLSTFGSYYSLLGVCSFCVLVLFCLLPIGSRKLGIAVPTYSRLSWLTMLYSTGMGSGLLLRAVQEPIYYLQNPPVGISSPEEALKFTFFHWGFTAWSFYAIFGLFYSLSRRPHQKDIHQTTSRWTMAFSLLEKGIISLSTVLGLVVAVVLGSSQWISGAAHLFDNPSLVDFSAVVVLIIIIVSSLSALSGLQNGIRILSNANIFLAVLVMLVVFCNTVSLELFVLFKNALLLYLQNFFKLSFNLAPQATSEIFRTEWTYFYWAFWLSWAPFTGLFLAKISQGRSVREFVLFTLVIPSLGSFIWFTVFGHGAIQILPSVQSPLFSSIYSSLFLFLDYFPMADLLKTIALINVLTFLITSVDSALYVISDEIDIAVKNKSQKRRIIWSAMLILVCSLFLTINEGSRLLTTVSQLLILSALPVSLLGGFYLTQLIALLVSKKGRHKRFSLF